MHVTQEAQAIEVEVVEIDGNAPVVKLDGRVEPQRQEWQDWQRRIRTLDGRWWPLWVFLGAIGLVLLLTFGVVIGVVFLVFKVIARILRTIFG